jgi:hypothetical protein
MALDTLPDSALLDLCEAGAGQLPARRALTILAAAFPEDAPAVLGALSPGRRDARLLSIRQAMFGPAMQSTTACPACGEQLEFTLAVADLLDPSAARETAASVEHDGHIVHFRLPTALDLAELSMAAGPAVEPNEVRRHLIEHCLLSAEHDGVAVALAGLPEPVLDEVVRQMAVLDPYGDLVLDMACVNCGHAWQATFDVVAYLWEEIRQRARHVLQEVHLLARAYGWSEDDVLALSSWRRRAYLELAYA